MFLKAVVEDEWFVFEEFLYSYGRENSRSSFSQVGETNAKQMALGGLETLELTKQRRRVRPI